MHGIKLNLEDNSEAVHIGKAMHEARENKVNTELLIENIKLDKLTSEYLIEVKKSDADVDAAKWQVLYYLKVLKSKGILRKGKLEFIEKHKVIKKQMIVELTQEYEQKLEELEKEILNLITGDVMPEVSPKSKCKNCAYFEYCHI